jgi:cob(I)alamin adenosyltransferase
MKLYTGKGDQGETAQWGGGRVRKDSARIATVGAVDAAVPPLRNFILPGGRLGAAHLHLARAMIRRAERDFVGLAGTGESVNPLIGVVLNRLSDLLFAAARYVNHVDGVEDIVWSGIPR